MDTWWEINKEQLRSRAKRTLATLSPENKKQQSIAICSELQKYNNTYQTWAVFIPFSYEPDILLFVQQLWEQDKIVLVPQIDNDWLRLAYYDSNSVISQWIYGEWVIKDPIRHNWSIDVCLVPWLAFDNQWWRIGHGKGLYDTFLATNTCFRIGVTYQETIVDHVPHDIHDQQMDILIR